MIIAGFFGVYRKAQKWDEPSMTEKRIIDLEIKVAHQEVLIEELNQVIYQQQKTTDKLEATISALVKRFQDLLTSGDEIRGPTKSRLITNFA